VLLSLEYDVGEGPLPRGEINKEIEVFSTIFEALIPKLLTLAAKNSFCQKKGWNSLFGSLVLGDKKEIPYSI
jgi:hypothetical protein